ncbi:MAG: hypothetical protein M3Q16_05220 [Pseudomonadota bacterium]|nr:hypothetical protein [Pseudomonadota bacterium]
MKFSPLLSAKSLALASALVFSVGVAHAQGYDQGGSAQKPADSMQSPGTSGGGPDYGARGNDQGKRYDSSRDNSRYSTDGTERYDDKDLYERTGTDGTGPKLKGRY